MKNIPSHIYFSDLIEDLLKEIIQKEDPDKIGILVDENTEKHCLPLLSIDAEVIKIESGEKNKNLNTCIHIWGELTERGFTRNSMLINLGGGVIGDMGGFVASTYKRGIKFINIPTTLLAQVDASIGGKLGIDFKGLKNHIGLFREPDHIIICSRFLDTLPENQLLSGFAEVIKHALIRDKSYWNILKSFNTLNEIEWGEIIGRSVQIKSEVVKSDPLENGLRKILNFGHTLGHAIETWKLLNNQELLHGEAIAIGIIIETRLSEQKQGLESKKADEIYDFITRFYSNSPLPPFEDIYNLMKQDKKNEKGRINFSLLKTTGSCNFNVKVTYENIEEAYIFYEKLYK